MPQTLAERAATATPMSKQELEQTYADTIKTHAFVAMNTEHVANICVSHEALRRQTSAECAKALEKLAAALAAFEVVEYLTDAACLRGALDCIGKINAILRGQA